MASRLVHMETVGSQDSRVLFLLLKVIFLKTFCLHEEKSEGERIMGGCLTDYFQVSRKLILL